MASKEKKSLHPSMYQKADRCPNCIDSVIIEDHRAGDLICSNCGLVIGDRVVDVASEWRSFSDKRGPDPNRVGAVIDPLLGGGGLNITVSSLKGQSGGSRDYEDALARASRNNASGSDRSVRGAFAEIAQMCSRSNLPDSIQSMAKIIYKQSKDHGSVVGHSHQAVAAACLYIACRREGHARSFREICAVSHVKSKKIIGRCYKKIIEALEIRLDNIHERMYMPRFCSKLNLPPSAIKICNTAAKRAVKIGVVEGKVPISIAAAAIYMSAQVLGVTKSKENVAEVTGVAEVTIRNSYREMYPVRWFLFVDSSVDMAKLDTIQDWGEPQKPKGLEHAITWAEKQGIKVPPQIRQKGGLGIKLENSA